MGKKGKKTRWRRLPIGGTDEESGLSLEAPTPPSDPHRHRVTFNEDEYTKITTPRQDVLFKKGYFGRKRTPPNPSPSETQEVHSGDSVENESYGSEEPQYAYPLPAGYMDPTGVYYVNGNTYESYDPYTGTVTVVVGPPAQYPGAPPVLAALPCQPVPLQSVEWFNPAAAAPWCCSYNRRKRYSTDSQNCSAQSSESTGPPGSPQEPVDEAAAAMYPPPPGPHYVYPGYMFGPPIYNMNGMTVQGVMPQPVPMTPDLTANKRRKKRRRRRRGGATDDGSESSCCEEPLTCDMTGCQSETSQSGASSDAGLGPNSDSGIITNSGSNSPPLEHQQHQHFYNGAMTSPCVQSVEECEVTVPDAEVEVSEELSTAEDDVTPNLCAAAPEFSSQESTLSCVSTPSAARDLLPNEQEISNDVTEEEFLESCHPTSSLQEITAKDQFKNVGGISPCQGTENKSLPQPLEVLPVSPNEILSLNDLTIHTEERVRDNVEGLLCELEKIPNALKNNVSYESELLEVEPLLNTHIESLKTSTNSENGKKSDSTSGELLDQHEEINVELQMHETPKSQQRGLNSAIEEEKGTEETRVEEENVNKVQVNFIFQPEKGTTISNQRWDELEFTQFEESDKVKVTAEEEIRIEEAIEQVCVMNVTATLDTVSPAGYDLHSSLQTSSSMLAPVPPPIPPPRRKKSMSRVADRVATRVVDDAIKEGLEKASRVRLKNPLSITEAVTRWLNSHESSPLTCPILDEESDNDEGIEVEEEESTGQKNVRGNPFLASSHSDAGQRVANDCESLSSAGEWDMWDHSHTREMCDPSRSVDRYYRLGADEGVPSVYKTAMHIRHTGPFPCGVCCIIQ